MFSMRPRHQEDHRCRQEQLFLSSVPASTAPRGKNKKKHETQRAGANVEEVGNPSAKVPGENGFEVLAIPSAIAED
jgi:hypothetical protein